MKRAIGIDIGGTKIAVAAVDERGAIIARETFATEAERGFDRAVGRMVDAARRLASCAGWPIETLCGIGIGCTGPVSAERGIINNPYTLPTWVECDIVGRLRDRLGLNAYLENDADAAALGEWFAGAGRHHGRLVMLTLGTGVGGGVILDGRVYRGAQGEHPELGHIPIDPNGPSCYCGARGCLESLASGTAITAGANQIGLADARELFQAAASGNPDAIAVLDRVRAALQTAAWTILHTFLPEVLILGGGIVEKHYDVFAPAMQSRIPRATMVPREGVKIVRAQLGNDAGLVGAASLALARA